MLENPTVQEIRSLTVRLIREGLIHPTMTALKETILDLVTNAPDSRAIVFAHYWDSRTFLVSELEKVQGVKPLRFVGQASRGSKDKGIPQKKQIKLPVQVKTIRLSLNLLITKLAKLLHAYLTLTQYKGALIRHRNLGN